MGGGGGMCGCSGGACVVFSQGAYVVFPGGGMHDFSWGGGMRRIRRDTVNERAVRILLECILVLPTNLMLILQHRNRRFAEAVEKSRQFYNLTLSDEEDQSQRGVLTHIIEAGTT